MSALAGSSARTVDIAGRPEFAGQRLLVASPVDRHGSKTLTGCELDAEVAQAADAVDGDQIAGLRAGMTQCIEGRDAGA